MYITYDESTGEIIGVNYRGTIEIDVDTSLLVHGKDPEFYRVVDGVLTPKLQTEVDAIIAQREADAAALAERLADIEDRRDASGLREFTLEQADTYLDNRFDAITSLATAKTELRKIIDKMVPYLQE